MRRFEFWRCWGTGDERAADAIVHELQSEAISVRHRAAIELGSLRSDRAVSALIEGLKDQDKGVRQFARRVLRVITGERIEANASA